METILQIENLSKRYGNIQAIDQISLNVEKGSVFGILGPNGSGKTTTLSIILGVVKADSGTFSWFGAPENQTINHRIGTTLETPNFYPYLTIYQNLKIIASIRNIPIDNELEFHRVLTITELYKRKDSKFGALSYGMRQRVALSALLLGDPEILILDEPTNGLDPQGIALVREIIQNEASRGKTILLASHILDEVEKVCSHIAILRSGKILIQNKAEKLLADDEDTIIIVCDRMDDFYELILKSGIIKNIRVQGSELHMNLIPPYNTFNINELAVKNGFILSKIEIKKPTLEEEFLKIVKQ